MRPACATATVQAPREAIFAFLEDLANHWRLAGRWIEVVELHPAHGPARGATVRLRGPAGLIRREVRTAVDEARAPAVLRGHAAAGPTLAAVRWDIEPHGDGSRVSVAVGLVGARAVDRALWRTGGRRWLSRRLRTAVERLDARVTEDLQIDLAVPTIGT
jgi:carbon monoxide dehydrogenase subunit G